MASQLLSLQALSAAAAAAGHKPGGPLPGMLQQAVAAAAAAAQQHPFMGQVSEAEIRAQVCLRRLPQLSSGAALYWRYAPFPVVHGGNTMNLWGAATLCE